jgi:putative FmdB family regulatory protein
MPTYDYRCKGCGKRFEKAMTMSEHERHPRPACPKCKGRRVEAIPSRFQAVTSKKT